MLREAWPEIRSQVSVPFTRGKVSSRGSRNGRPGCDRAGFVVLGSTRASRTYRSHRGNCLREPILARTSSSGGGG
jgi:hypothetical protein